jgi:molybdopterin converting factor small subunit
MVTVRYLSYLKIAAGMKEEMFELSNGTSAGEIIRTLAEEHGGELKDRLISRDGGLKVVFSINGEKAGEGAELCEGDVLSVMPPLAGG